jgi:putative ABC transport system permease protein
MSHRLGQVIAVTLLNLRSVPERLGSSMVTVIGIAGVVAVLISVLALSIGLRRTIDNTARADRAIVLSRGAEFEGASGLNREAVATIFAAQGIKKNAAGQPLVSAEAIMIAPVSRKRDGVDAYVTLRGISSAGTEVRPEVRVIEGRMFIQGLREVIVGRGAQARFARLNVGDRVTLSGGEWTVVGTFESGGNALESGLLTDTTTVRAAYNINTFSSVTVRLSSPEAYTAFKDSLSSNPTLDVNVQREADYMGNLSKPIHRILRRLAYSIGTVMSVGALFGALNTLHFSVSSRSREIATLRALGFSGGSVVASVLIESLLLSLLGAAIGALIAYALFNGEAISTVGGIMRGAQLVYELHVTPKLIVLGTVVAVTVGLIGGLFPSMRAARVSIAGGLSAI